MAELLREELSIETKLVGGGRGIFEVAVDGAVVAKKTQLGFPEDRQIVEAVRARLSGSS